MAKYRIVRISRGSRMPQYEVQKRSVFGFWYNPLNIDAYTTGIFDDAGQARQAIEDLKAGTIKEVVEEL